MLGRLRDLRALARGAGHEVHLVDLTPRHVELVRAEGGIASGTVGDARSLAWPDASFDAVLLLGPLYHLQEREDRLRALGQARRVLYRGGVVFAAGISRWASLLAGLTENLLDDADFGPMMERDLAEGRSSRRPVSIALRSSRAGSKRRASSFSNWLRSKDRAGWRATSRSGGPIRSNRLACSTWCAASRLRAS
jgi:SAM-dependent methyltransferase